MFRERAAKRQHSGAATDVVPSTECRHGANACPEVQLILEKKYVLQICSNLKQVPLLYFGDVFLGSSQKSIELNMKF